MAWYQILLLFLWSKTDMSELTARMSATPLAAPALALAGGIVCGRYVSSPWPAVVCAIAMGIAAIVLCLPYLMRDKAHRFSKIHAQRNFIWWLVIPGCMLVGILLIRESGSRDADDISRPYASGVVTEAVSTTGGERLTVRVESLISDTGIKEHTKPFKVLIYTGACEVRAGDAITFRANLGAVADAESEPGRREYLYANGIDYTSSTPESAISVTGHDNSLRLRALEWRDQAVAGIEHTPLAPDTKAFLAALLTGDKEGLSAHTRERFAGAGIAHILALSGLHVGIILAILGALLLALDLAGGRTLRYLLMALGICLFALFTGLRPSVVRACVMAVCMLGALTLQRPGSALNALCLAACLILGADPRALFDVGLQLSFLCTLTILTLVRTLPKGRENHLGMRLAAAAAIPCAIFLITWPLSAYHFHNVPLLFLPLNLIVLPLLPPFTACVLLYMVLCACGWTPGWLTALIDGAYSVIDRLAGAISEVEFAQATLFPHPFVAVGGTVAALSLMYWLRARTRGAGACAISAMLATLGAAIILPDNTPADSLTIPALYDRMEIRHTRGGVSESTPLRDGAASLIRLGETRLLYLDSRLPEGPGQADILVVGKNCDSHPDSVLTRVRPARLVLSPTLYPGQEERWVRAAGRRDIASHRLSEAPYTQPL